MAAFKRASIRKWFMSYPAWVVIVFLLIAGFFLVTEHRAHLFGALPYALVLLCPLLHIFMHRGHGSHGSDNEQ